MILVTGGAGYIGSVLVPMLLGRGYTVKVLDTCYFGLDSLSDVSDSIYVIHGDLRQFDPCWLDDVKAVIHLGGLSNDPTAEFNPVANREINTVGTQLLVDACIERKIKRFTFASTCSIYDTFDSGLYSPFRCFLASN